MQEQCAPTIPILQSRMCTTTGKKQSLFSNRRKAGKPGKEGELHL